ncbi:diaminopimelate decarboxylase [Clostridium sp. 'deep sea']|uniref:diaminopimelate decarboxylase n=1 Tax=Clostridium sp. 'deep sea' TaxID=2779445 RepID=UPI0018967D84|nr:diaminopimelate decarboxylase [Clostridium sp. 'deep sea']QOR34140.1 diaminopimelate decarboxylase [Clostridium sp. 'deep sea']
MKLRGTMRVNSEGVLTVGNVSTKQLAQKYKTPLYIIDQQCIEENIKNFKSWFSSDILDTQIVYASKALINGYMCNLIAENGLGIDVISKGDMVLLHKCNYPLNRVYLHGNAKSEAELEFALKHGVGRIVVDNFDELDRIKEICTKNDYKTKILIRVNPGVKTHTHKYLRTALDSSKFGISLYRQNSYEKIKQLKNDPHIELVGIHCHIGSQINEEAAFMRTVEVMLNFCLEILNKTGIELTEINYGGGFAIYYAKRDTPPDLSALLPAVIKKTEEQIKKNNLNIKKVIIEPGRSIVGAAGTTLYKIEAHKTTYSGRKYLMVDGGMSDNPRPALYNAQYEAVIVDKMLQDPINRVAVAGKCCESGDILIDDIVFPETKNGDIIAVAATGAYNYSMASNYNGLPRPAMVAVKNSKDILITKREEINRLHECDVNVDTLE